MPRRYTDEEVEARVVPELVSALYPVLIPMEQQDCAIQARNHALVTQVATVAWRFFAIADKRSSRMVRDALGIAHGQNAGGEK